MKKYVFILISSLFIISSLFAEDLHISGEVVSDNNIIIKSLTTGVITYLPWRSGDIIRKGDTVAVVYRDFYDNDRKLKLQQLISAQKVLEDYTAPPRKEKVRQLNEKINYLKEYAAYLKEDSENIKKLVDKKMVPLEDYDKSRLQYLKTVSELNSLIEELEILKTGPTQTQINLKKAVIKEKKASLELSESILQECYISSPFTGKTIEVFKRENEYVKPGESLLQIYQTNSCIIRFAVSEKYYNKISKNMKLLVTIDALNGQTFKGNILRIYPNIDKVTRTFIVEAKLKDTSVKIIPGMFVRISIAIK